MVGEVEKLGSELQVRAFGGAEIFEQGEVQSVKTGAIELRRGAAQGRAIRLAYGGRDGRARKGRGVQPLVHVVRTSVFVLSGNEQSITAKPGSRGNNTRNGKGLAILERENPVGFPAAKHTVDDRSTICEEALSFADGQLVGAAEMEDLGDVEIAQAVVSLDTEPREPRGTIKEDRKSTRLNSSHGYISYAVFCLKKKKKILDSILILVAKLMYY